MSEVQVVEPVEVLVPLEQQEAERLDKRLRLMAGTTRDNFEKVGRLLDEAKRGQIHQVLGFKSWTAYVADAVGGQLELSGDARQAMVQMLAGEGMSVRAIAAATGVSKSTVSNDLAAAEVSNHATPESDSADSGVQPLDTSEVTTLADGDAALADELNVTLKKPAAATVTGIDGKTYTRKPRKPRAKKEPAKPAPEAEPAPDPVKAERKVQIPTALRAEVKLLGLAIDLMGSLTQDSRWDKARLRFTSEDRATLDAQIAALQEIRAAMGDEHMAGG